MDNMPNMESEALKRQKRLQDLRYQQRQDQRQHTDESIPEVTEEIDLSNLAPRSRDLDLKRNSAEKLAKLEKRRQRSMAILIRQRLMD